MTEQPKTSEQIIALKQRITDALFEYPNVVGVDVGYKETGGELTDQLTIRVHVRKKDPTLPETHRIPASIEGVETDIIVGDYGYLAEFLVRDKIERIDEVQYPEIVGGSTISVLDANGRAHSGTLGCLARRKSDGRTVALTNAHVTGGEFSEGETCFHPYPWSANARLGRVLNAVRNGEIDAAISSVDERIADFRIVDIGPVRGSSNVIVTGMRVSKRGRQTRLTHGMVEAVHGTFRMADGLIFKDVITIRPQGASDFSVSGDSGAVILNEQNQVVAQLYAGFDSLRFEQTRVAGRTLAVPIWKVLRELDIEIPVQRSEVVIDKPVVPARPTLRLGARGPQVGILQTLLSGKQFPISTDGLFGLRTRYAVMIFQMESGLQPDGIVGQQTWSRLEAVA